MPRRPAIFLASLLAAGHPVLSGSVDNRNNNSADYIRSVSRNSSIEGADIAIYNPAATALLRDGLHISLSNQTVGKFNEHRLRNFGNTYESEIVTPLYPTGFLIYKRGTWAGFAAFSFPGGGGELLYEQGSAAVIPLQSNLEGFKPSRDANTYLRSVYYGGTIGAAWSPLQWLSVSAGARLTYARTDIEVDADTSLPPANSSKLVDHMEEATGMTGVLGADFFPLPGLTLALRFEGLTPLEWEVQRSTLNIDRVILDTALRARYIGTLRQQLRPQGATFQRDLPANLGLGVGYAVIPALRVDLSYNYYMNTLADWDGKENDHDDGWEAALGLEYSLPMGLKLSAGGMYTVTGANSSNYFVESPALDSYTLGTGAKYTLRNRLSFIAGFAANLTFEDDANIPGLGRADLEKNVMVYALGVEYRAL